MDADKPRPMHQPETFFFGELQEFEGQALSPDDPSLEPRLAVGAPLTARRTRDTTCPMMTKPSDVAMRMNVTSEMLSLEEVMPILIQDTDVTTELNQRFVELANQWKRERGPHSSSARLAEHPAYQAIVAMGSEAVPLLLRELEREPDHWFRALVALTGANPVPPESQGKLHEMAKAWLAWGANTLRSSAQLNRGIA